MANCDCLFKVRRGVPRVSGIYVKGQVEGVDLVYTVDTGASATLISTRILKEIPKTQQPPLDTTPTSHFVGPTGDTIKVLGKVTLHMNIGGAEIIKKVTVANIHDDCLLGADILLGLEQGPFDFHLSENRLQWNGISIPCIQVKNSFSCKVLCASDCVIPGYSEKLVDTVVLSTDPSIEDGTEVILHEVLIEPENTFHDKYRLLMASCLVRLREDRCSKVRVMNPFPREVEIKDGAIMGEAIPFDQVIPFLDEESPADSDERDNIRRLQVPERELIGNVANPSYSDSENAMDVSTNSSVPVVVPLHLQDLYNRTVCDLQPTDHSKVGELLYTFGDTFSKNDDDLGCTNLTTHVIDTGTARPIKQAPRRTPVAYEGRDKEALEKMLNRGIIRESSSPWASPVVLVPKKDGSVRLCADYRKINDVTTKDAFPLPKISDCLDAVSGSVYFSTLDLTSGYNQVPVAEEDIPKTAFVTKYGLFECPYMPFGLSNAPATFQRVMELALQGLQWSTCLIYIDDIIVFGGNIDEHLSRVRGVLERLRSANLKIKAEKCHLLEKEVLFLGHVLSGDGVKPSPTNVDRILSWNPPKSTKQVRQFLGMATYYRRFIKEFAKLATPLSKLTSKNVKFYWNEECQRAFEDLKAALTGPDIMAYPLNDGEFVLDTDACDTAVGAVLSQVQNGQERVVAYASRVLNKAERNYCVTDKELLAVKHFIEYFYQYLAGRHFLVRTDHQPLKWLFSLKAPRGRIARWLLILSGYNFSIEYRKGVKHGNADAMSRCPNPKDCECVFEDDDSALKCGPCAKCLHRSEVMESEWSCVSGPLKVNRVAVDLFNEMEDGEEMARSKDFSDGEHNTLTDSYTEMWCGYMSKLQPFMVWLASVLMVVTVCGGHVDWLMLTAISGGIFLLRLVKDMQDCGGFAVVRSAVPCVWFQGYTHTELKRLQEQDSVLSVVIGWLKMGKIPSIKDVCGKSPALRHYWIYWNSLEMREGILCRRYFKQDGTGNYLQFVVPKELRDEVLRMMHDCVLAGHLGRKKTEQKLLQRFYWYQVRDDVKLWVTKCEVCQMNKIPPKRPKAPLGNMLAGAPLDRMCTDVLGPFPTTQRGNRFILVVTDSFTKWTEIFAIKNETAETCAEVILNEVICRFGCPLSLHTDQGRNYESKIFKELCDLLNIRKTRTSPKNPKGNGQTERFNRTLLPMIRAYINDEQGNWDLNLGCLAGAYRATPHDSTTLTPNLMMLGREVRLPHEVVFGSSVPRNKFETVANYGAYVTELNSSLQRAHKVARKHLNKAAATQKTRYDVHATLNSYQVGDMVWLLNETRETGKCPKLQPAFLGPYVVIARYGKINFKIQLDGTGKSRVVHHDKLKIYTGVHPPSWTKKVIKTLKVNLGKKCDRQVQTDAVGEAPTMED